MRGLGISCALLASFAGVASARAQTAASPDLPKFLMWGEAIPCGVSPGPNDFLTHMAKFWIAVDRPADCSGRYIANYVKEHTRYSYWSNWNEDEAPNCFATVADDCYGTTTVHAPDLFGPTPANPNSPSNICFGLQNIGADGGGVDNPNDAAWVASRLRLFRWEDRLPDYKNGTLRNNTDATYGFPVPIAYTGTNTDPAWFSNRAYRHPFIENAMSSTAPLRQYMEELIEAYHQKQLADPTIPDPLRWYFDTEPYPTWAGSMDERVASLNANKTSANCVYIVEQIYASRNTPNATLYPNYWNGVPVPGQVPDSQHPNGWTLLQVYLRDAEKFDLPLYAAGHPQAGQPNLEAFGGGTSAAPRPASHPNNYKIMAWWAEVSQAAMERAMENCCYEPIKARWPNAKVGNYATSRNTGQLRPMGITQDSECQSDACWDADYNSRVGATNLPASNSTTYVQYMPSCTRTGGIDSAGMWHVNPDRPNGGGLLDLGWESERRWGSVVSKAFGDVDSPVLYSLPETNNYYVRFRQRNAYARKYTVDEAFVNLPELRHEASMRWYRETVESTNAGYCADQQSHPLVPWIYPVGLKIDGGTPPPLMSTGELAQLLAMLRGKRISEAIVFSSIPYNSGDAVTSWTKTERAIKDVYSPRIVSAARSNQDGTTNLNIETEVPLLSETLRDSSQQRRTVSISSTLSGPCDRWAALSVNFLDNYPQYEGQPGLSRLVTDSLVPRDFQVNIECQAFDLAGNPKLNVNYKVACGRADNLFVALASFDGDILVSSGRNPFGETRCSWGVPNSLQDPESLRLDPSKIQILATSQDCEPFTVKFDLVQVVPQTFSQARLLGYECVPPIVLGATAPPTTVDGMVFGSEGLQLAWSLPFDPETRPGESPHYIRVYRHTGDPDHPLVDMTCKTYQEVRAEIDPPSSQRYVFIWYKPSEIGGYKRLPPGDYLFRTYDRGEASIQSVCDEPHYSRLRTRLSGPMDLNPYLAPEHFVLRVMGDANAPPACSFNCPSSLRECLADLDDGSSQGIPDGGVTIDDLLYYLLIFEVGASPCADVDGGAGDGCPDGGITIDDLLYFLYRFEVGC